MSRRKLVLYMRNGKGEGQWRGEMEMQRMNMEMERRVRRMEARKLKKAPPLVCSLGKVLDVPANSQMQKMMMKKDEGGSGVPVYLNVYDITLINGCAYFLGLGVYHSGVQVYDVEYAFGAHEFPTTGVFEGEPRQCHGFSFRKSIMIGRTGLSPKEVRRLMEELAEEYTGDTYHLISRNCNHFCNDACLRLTGKRIPLWVNRLARIGMLFNCVFPKNVHPEKVRHRSEDGTHSSERKKLRSNSSRYCSSLQPPPPTISIDVHLPKPCTSKAIVRSKRRCSSLSAPPLLTSAALNL